MFAIQTNVTLRLIEFLIFGVLILAAILDTIRGYWANAFVLLVAVSVMFVPVVLKRVYEIETPRLLYTGLIIFIFTTVFLGEVRHFYDRFWWWDFVLHAVAGFGLTLIGHILLALIHRKSSAEPPPFLLSVFAFSFAVAVSAVWEIYEFIVDYIRETSNMQPSNSDTMWDLIGGSGASLLAAYIGWKWWHMPQRKNNNMVAEAINDGVDGIPADKI